MCFLISDVGLLLMMQSFFLGRNRLSYQYSEVEWETLPTLPLTWQFVQYNLLSLLHLLVNLLFHKVYDTSSQTMGRN